MVSGMKANSRLWYCHCLCGTRATRMKHSGFWRKRLEERQPLVALKEIPTLENLHSDPRWQALLRRMNFPAD